MNIGINTQWLEDGQEIDRGIIIGVSVSILLIGIGIVAGGHVLNFLDIEGLLIVLGGTFGGSLIHFSMYDLEHAWQTFQRMLFTRAFHPMDRIQQLVTLAQPIRQEGLLILEREANNCEDPFLKMGLELTVDGRPGDDIKRIMETEVRVSNDRALRAIHVFETMGNYAPAMGLIGTLIGLIRMLSQLDSPATVGPAMSVALVATFYGAVFSNLVFLPLAGKLKNRAEEEALVKAITIEGVLSLGKQENPIVIEQRLQGFLPLTPV